MILQRCGEEERRHFLPVRWLTPFALFCSLLNAQSALDTANANCSDPLLAVNSACASQQQSSGSFHPIAGQSGSSNTPSAIPPLSPSIYSDFERYSQPEGHQTNAQQTPEPLTEFQKFVASSTGMVLPVYGANLFQRVPSTFAPLDMAPVPPDYVIGPGDELRIRVWGQVNVQANLRVDRSGEIYLPQIGNVHVAGLPFSELDTHVRAAVGRVYRNFDLTADIGQIRSIQVYVSGEARQPGVYTVSSLSTLVDALFASGGPKQEGSMRSIELRRNGEVVTRIDLYDLLIRGDKTKDAKLLPGDVIFIPRVGAQVAVLGSVRNPGIYEALPQESLGEVLTEAGGVSAVAAEARISIERIDEHRDRGAMEVAYDTAGRNVVLAEGDVIRVYSIVPKYEKTVTLRGNVANPGRFAWHDGMRLSELIPDKESLLTRNYWWKRAQMGLSAPEFEPIPGFANLVQPADNHPLTVQQSLERQTQTFAPNGLPNQQLLQQDLSGSNAAQSQYGDMFGYGTSENQQDHNGIGQDPNQPLNTGERAGNASLADTQALPRNQVRQARPRTMVRLPAPEIDWDYAVIERLNRETLKTDLIPFDLGKLVLQHDPTQDLVLQPNDVVTIFSDADIRVPIAEETKLVRLEGEFVHSGVYSAQPGETLRHLVERAGGLTQNAYLYGSEFTRESTRIVQQVRIDEYVQSLALNIQRGAVQLASSASASPQTAANSGAAQASEQNLLAALREVRATGRIVLEFSPASKGVETIPDVALEDGDRFIVPHAPTAVNVVGSVYNQNSFMYRVGGRTGTYLRLAGGPNRDADQRRAFVIRANGEVVSRNMTKGPWGNEFNDLRIYPGDTIVVPEKTFKPSALYGVMNWSQMFSQLAIGAASLSIVAP